MPGRTRLLIGDVAALTGISAGRIRHYEARGLLAPAHLGSGYRTFSAEDVLRLLRIDVLRSLGMGLEEIRECVRDDPASLREALERHRETLAAERDRIDGLLTAVAGALAGPADDPEAVMRHLATSHRDSLGLFGRLSRPLSGPAADVLHGLLGTLTASVPPLFGQMVLPHPVTDLLERLARAPGREELFARLERLSRQVAALPDDPAAAAALADAWVREQLDTPLPEPMLDVLRACAPRLADLPVIRHGFLAWSEAFAPLAGTVFREVEARARRLGAEAITVLVIPPGRP